MDLTCAGLLTPFPDEATRPAVYANNGELALTRGQLRADVAQWAERFASSAPKLIFLFCRNDPSTLTALLAGIAAGHMVALLDPSAPQAAVRQLLDAYDPEIVIGPSEFVAALSLEGVAWSAAQTSIVQRREEAGPGRPTLVLLSTSGTTGSAKFVRLTGASVAANASQIAGALRITPADVGVAHLPIHYSYGLSVVTSHLQAGAAVHLWSDTVTVPEFWEAVRRAGGTQMPGVPFHYQFLARANLSKLAPPSLRTFTQAGGPLDTRLQSRFHKMVDDLEYRFFVMYGQTEAAPRITTLPHESLPTKLGSVGPALAGGRLTVLDEAGAPLPSGQIGSIVYEGPNVMLGYAQSRADLGKGDEVGGRIETGDLGYLDHDGYLYLTGRTKRIAKLHGLRLSLDEVEARFRSVGEVAAVEGPDRIILFTANPDAVSECAISVAEEYKLPSSTFVVRLVDAIPRKSSGKVDYNALNDVV